ncbi:MAG: hypothetical protein CVU65_05340 [Deltaproteobacteria bacterium HGW-Deltaproteobacteria-22]|jgi:hypothetical protein|nr:MAG: hypothetical protein CVU65_05340 [Deltaproteobacteria bacterium HGW-Deltaproteobacteria-22]
MAPQQVNTKVVQGLLYGIYKSLHNLAGSSAAAIMRQAAPDILAQLNELGVDFSCVDSVEKLESKLGETLVSAGMCDKMEFRLEGNRLKTNITNCSFFELTMKLKAEGIPPFGCPFAALTIAIAEKNLGKRARLVDLKPTPGGQPGDTYLEVELN